MLKQNIPTDIKKITKLYQVSDIHIRNLKRHEEYAIVFKELAETIKNSIDDSTVIVCTGDVVHAKTEMSPELIKMTTDFLTMLADIADTILITGNHDCNLNNKYRLDALSPIISNMRHPKLHYLRLSGVYTMVNIDFAVCSRLDDISEWPTIDDCSNDCNVVLYHGTIDNAVSDTGFKLTNENIKTNRFNGFDFGLFGDIHKLQTIQKYSYTEEQIDESELEHYISKGWRVK